MLSPLTGLVDAAQADSQAARQFAKLVDQLLSDAPQFNSEAVRQVLSEWRDAGPELKLIIERAPALHEAKPLADDLSDIAAIGLEAVGYIADGVVPTAQWRDAKLARLDQAGKPKAALEFANIRSVKLLVIAAAELPSLHQSSPAEWKARVKALADQPAK
jgi:hypothetical protein